MILKVSCLMLIREILMLKYTYSSTTIFYNRYLSLYLFRKKDVVNYTMDTRKIAGFGLVMIFLVGLFSFVDANGFDSVEIIAHKIVCDDESDLPDWGWTTGSEFFISQTTHSYVDSHSGCHFESISNISAEFYYHVIGDYEFDNHYGMNGSIFWEIYCSVEFNSGEEYDDEESEVICYKDSDCGEPSCGGPNYCMDGDVYQDFNVPVCNNPGKNNSYCSSHVAPWLIQDCTYGCLSGRCIFEIEIDFDGDGYNNSVDCDDYNYYVNPGMDENCSTDYDDNCDGNINEGCGVCVSGDVESEQCGLTNIGVCEFGERSRICVNENWGSWSSCIGEVKPVDEICWNGLDDDCDGFIDEGCGVEDDVPPASISNLHVVDIEKYKIRWAWDNPDDVDFYLNLIYLDGVNVLNTSDNFYNADGLESGVFYKISVYTMDNSSNINWVGVFDSVRTLKSRSGSSRSSRDYGDVNYIVSDEGATRSNSIVFSVPSAIQLGGEVKDDFDWMMLWIWILVGMILLVLLVLIILIFR